MIRTTLIAAAIAIAQQFNPAMAHLAQAPWLQHGDLKDPRTGQHCCNRVDCWSVPDAKVVHRNNKYWFPSDEGVWSIPEDQVRFRQDNKRDWIVCKYGNHTKRLRCAFRPYQGARRKGDVDA